MDPSIANKSNFASPQLMRRKTMTPAYTPIESMSPALNSDIAYFQKKGLVPSPPNGLTNVKARLSPDAEK